MNHFRALAGEVGDFLRLPREKRPAKPGLADRVIAALHQVPLPPPYEQDSLLTALRELAFRGYCSDAQVAILVRISIDTDSDNAAEQSLKTLTMLASRRTLLKHCRVFIERAGLDTHWGRWVAFYAASVLLAAKRTTLLSPEHIQRLRNGLSAETGDSNTYKTLARTLKLVESAFRLSAPGAKQHRGPTVRRQSTGEADFHEFPVVGSNPLASQSL